MSGVYKLDKSKFDTFKKHLKRLGFTFEDRPYQVFLARYDKFTLNLYDSGKITFGGNDKIQNEVEWFLKAKLGASSSDSAPGMGLDRKSRIGTDEVGKGDYFGPVVVGGVFVTPEIESDLKDAGVKDSKEIRSDERIQLTAGSIRRIVGKDGYDVVSIGPERYNSLYKKLGNLNLLLGWAHARAIENLLEKNPDCRLAVADKFGDASFIDKALMSKGKEIELVQVHKGERDIAIASASILARDRFIKSMKKMNTEYDIEFPRGSSENINHMGGRLIEEYGVDILEKVAKLNFSITKKIVASTKKR